MSEQLESVIDRLKGPARQGLIGRLRRGIEKEGLRVDPHGHIAQTPHPSSLGSKLTHPHITTDYSEALLEYITPVYCRPQDAMAFLGDLHRFSNQHLGNELLWPASMPSRLNGNDSVPIADYGRSNVGTMKHVYRKGLDVRYGRIMQSIAGVHYNVSLPDDLWRRLHELNGQDDVSLNDYRSSRYFGLIRHFRRNSWLLMYLFGASPALDDSFLDGKAVPAKLERHGDNTLLSRHATTLRMSDLGYQNKVQAQLKICFNSLSNYVGTLRHAISTPWPPYQAIGVNEGGEWRQLNANILQIENEYYSDIRPKRVARHDETPSQALEARGVEYIEVRCLDLNPFLPLGIDETQMRFLDTFLMWCLLSDSPWIPDDECDRLDDNRELIVERGRDPDLELMFDDGRRTLADRGREIFAEMQRVAELMDIIDGNGGHQQALAELEPRLDNPDTTPAGRLDTLLRESGRDFIEAMLELANRQADELGESPISQARQALFDELSSTSLQQQVDIERADTESFDAFLAHYFARAREPRAARAV
ncbi:glutamate--cysteine ligase [Aidingimonas halophila]|uniref:Glutamate--cysteine ligase n=1 Tax=Aidingimonas halophila TaxID=574349 RepID=A0A1H2RV22_9GAMM|nr:glutamate--cysteine ligase [Aidingimonas halophila]GHC18650.1 glutamate--cysteine ligase [Aidingimonas halophila]SDW23322.1 glutamate-cysteine ligase [Aidingimonas halophila]